MTDSALATQPTRQAIEARDRSAPGKVTGRLRKALDGMVWEGSKRDEAAIAAGMTVHGLREALKRPHVKAYYLLQLEVLRTSERARNIHALVEVRDQQQNKMARVQAVGMLERIAEDGARERPAAPFQGLIVQVITAPLSTPQREVIIGQQPSSHRDVE